VAVRLLYFLPGLSLWYALIDDHARQFEEGL